MDIPRERYLKHPSRGCNLQKIMVETMYRACDHWNKKLGKEDSAVLREENLAGNSLMGFEIFAEHIIKTVPFKNDFMCLPLLFTIHPEIPKGKAILRKTVS